MRYGETVRNGSEGEAFRCPSHMTSKSFLLRPLFVSRCRMFAKHLSLYLHRASRRFAKLLSSYHFIPHLPFKSLVITVSEGSQQAEQDNKKTTSLNSLSLLPSICLFIIILVKSW